MKNKKVILIIAIIILVIGIAAIFLMINGGKDSTTDEQKNIISAKQEAESEKYFEWNGTKITSLTEEGQNQKTWCLIKLKI